MWQRQHNYAGAPVKNVSELASVNINNSETPVKNVVAMASASINISRPSVYNVAAPASVNMNKSGHLQRMKAFLAKIWQTMGTPAINAKA